VRHGLRTSDEIHLASRLRTAGTPRASVVLVHGFSASGDDPHVSRLADALHESELDVVTYDARGHGASGGECTLGDLERHDVAAAVTLARRRTDRVVLVGASMGAIAVLRHAAADPQVGGVVAVSCPARWRLPKNARSVLAAGLTRTSPGRALASRVLRVRIASRWTNAEPPLALVPRLRAPLALVHGADDRFIPPADAQELHAAATGPCRLTLVPRMGHAFDAAGLPAIAAAVEWTLGVAGRPEGPAPRP
jgi:pimeloyl-ACP methyl ester carboxylesterase